MVARASASACFLPEAIALFREKHLRIELASDEGASESRAILGEQGCLESGPIQMPAIGGSFETQVILKERFLFQRRRRVHWLRCTTSQRRAI